MNNTKNLHVNRLALSVFLTLLISACGGSGDSDNNGNNVTRDIGLYFNEVMREVRLNESSGFKDEDDTRQPWVEIYNSTESPIDLSGFKLVAADDDQHSWTFPKRTLSGGGFLRVWGSGKDRAYSNGELHTDFSFISTDILVLQDNTAANLDTLELSTIPADQSYGRYPDGETWSYFYTQPSPSNSNPEGDYRLSANCHDLSLSVGQPFQAKVIPETNVSWSSDNKLVTVDSKGKIKAVKQAYGADARATVSAVDENGNSLECKVTIVGWTANRSSLKIVGTPQADFLLDKFDNKVYFTYPGKIYESSDGMRSSTAVGTFPPTPSSPVMKKTPYGYFASSGNTIYSSPDFNRWDVELEMRHKNLQHGLTHFFDTSSNTSYLYAGEYSIGNSDVHSVYRGVTQGSNVQWDEVLYFGSLKDFYRNNSNLDTIRHVHLVIADPYTGHVWVGTGDNNQHSRLYYSADNGQSFTLVGVGSQKFRSLSVWFTKDYVYWNMDSELVKQHVYRLPRSVHNQQGKWPSLTPELTSGLTKPGINYLVTSTAGGRFPVATGGIYTENTARTIDGSNRVRPIEDPAYDYSEDVAELTHASHWYHLWVKDQNGDDVLIMNTSTEGIDEFLLDEKSRTFGFKERRDGSVDIQELMSMPSNTPGVHNPYSQLTPHFQDDNGNIYFQGRDTAHRIYKTRLHWVDQ